MYIKRGKIQKKSYYDFTQIFVGYEVSLRQAFPPLN
jgi:hypothetical protein